MAGSSSHVSHPPDAHSHSAEQSLNNFSHEKNSSVQKTRPKPKKRGRPTDDAEERSSTGAKNQSVILLCTSQCAVLTKTRPWWRSGTSLLPHRGRSKPRLMIWYSQSNHRPQPTSETSMRRWCQHHPTPLLSPAGNWWLSRTQTHYGTSQRVDDSHRSNLHGQLWRR